MKKISLFILLSSLLFSCTNSTTTETGNNEAKVKQQQLIRELETQLHASTTADVQVGRKAVHEYLNYAAMYPGDSLSANYLFKGGEIATAVKDYAIALHCYEMITKDYPSFAYTRESLYLQGYINDNFLNDDAKAKIIYEQFLSKYPSGNYSEDAKAAIANLGKSDLELVREFEKKARLR